MINRKGIILAGGSGTRLHPATLAVSKQLLPIYDKPMIYYPLSTLMQMGIREILIISTPHDLPSFERLLGDGTQLGVKFSYIEQPSPDGLAQALIIGESFLNGAPSCLILGDNLFYGNELINSIDRANKRYEGATIFGYPVSDPARYGIVEFNSNGKVISLEEKPDNPKSNYAVPGIYFYDAKAPSYSKNLKPSKRGELEITDLNKCYLADSTLHVEILGRGNAWLDTGTHQSLSEASSLVEAIQNRQGLQIGCLEEISISNNWINKEELNESIMAMGKSAYALYLKELLREK